MTWTSDFLTLTDTSVLTEGALAFDPDEAWKAKVDPGDEAGGEMSYVRGVPTEGDDVIYALMAGSNDTTVIHALGGNDSVYGSRGHCVFYGEDGNDSLDGSSYADQLFGGAGDDTLLGDEDRDTLSGGDGDDLIRGDDVFAYQRTIATAVGAYADHITGDAGNDTIFGRAGADWIDGGTGNDVISGGFRGDVLLGGDGDDFLFGGIGGETYANLGGDTFISGMRFYDRLTGGAGADRFYTTVPDGRGTDRIADYDASEGDMLVVGGDGLDASDLRWQVHATADAWNNGNPDLVTVRLDVQFAPGQFGQAFVLERMEIGEQIVLRLPGGGEPELTFEVGTDQIL